MIRPPIRIFMKNDIRTRAEDGFSLVEVTIAMAIAAVAIVTLLGMIPQGMNSMVEATDQAIEARIQQQVLNEIQLTPFEDAQGVSLLDDFRSLEVYYDSQGEEIGDSVSGAKGDSGGKGSFGHVYTARVSVLSANPADNLNKTAPNRLGGADYRGMSFDRGQDLSQTNEGNPYIRTVIIEIAAVGGRADTFDFDETTNFGEISTFQTAIVKTGRDYRP